MSASSLIRAAAQVPCQPLPRYRLSHEQWSALAAALGPEPTLALLALWADPAHVYALFHDEAGAGFLFASTAVAAGSYPALSPARPAAAWFERMVRDLWGHAAEGGRDGRPWLDHGRWTVTAPLAAHPMPRAGRPEPPEFLPVEGEDLHQIPIGPVHAGIIESGHFRFTAAGETVVRLEVRLGYAHKGTLALLRGKSPRAAARFAARLAGDATVAHSIAFARAAEEASGVVCPPRAAALRAAMAELERIACHLSDLAATAEAAGLPAAAASWLREGVARAAQAAFGHRLMMDFVLPGGVASDMLVGGADALAAVTRAVEMALPDIADLFAPTTRLAGCGVLPTAVAQALAVGGVAGRASGVGGGRRRAMADAPHLAEAPAPAAGDAAARTAQRLAEINASLAQLTRLLAALPDGPLSVHLPPVGGEGIGWAEGARGDVWHWLRLEGGQIMAGFARDPGWLLWPALEAAAVGATLADLPLLLASFGATVSGMDL